MPSNIPEARSDKSTTKGPVKKLGSFSGTPHSAFVCQEVRTRASLATTLEVQTTLGDVLGSHRLAEPSAGHQITPDGQWVYLLTGGTGHRQRLVEAPDRRESATRARA